jgi:hypothetical protein
MTDDSSITTTLGLMFILSSFSYIDCCKDIAVMQCFKHICHFLA